MLLTTDRAPLWGHAVRLTTGEALFCSLAVNHSSVWHSPLCMIDEGHICTFAQLPTRETIPMVIGLLRFLRWLPYSLAQDPTPIRKASFTGDTLSQSSRGQGGVEAMREPLPELLLIFPGLPKHLCPFVYILHKAHYHLLAVGVFSCAIYAAFPPSLLLSEFWQNTCCNPLSRFRHARGERL
ncbi:hypothetical protein BR93DRAFT_462185 [Coniochaeta sp. PMI_546]|nr:hypothetical protein BR93DRAFT_462185 [Coniochaeta sp. PMI_546]